MNEDIKDTWDRPALVVEVVLARFRVELHTYRRRCVGFRLNDLTPA